MVTDYRCHESPSDVFSEGTGCIMYEIFFVNLSVTILFLVFKISNTSSEQAEITRNIPIKIALNLQKSLFIQKLLVIQHNAFCRMFYRDCSK